MQCGAELAPGYRFCEKCGQPAQGTAVRNKQPINIGWLLFSARGRLNRAPYLVSMIVLGVLGAIVGGILAFFVIAPDAAWFYDWHLEYAAEYREWAAEYRKQGEYAQAREWEDYAEELEGPGKWKMYLTAAGTMLIILAGICVLFGAGPMLKRLHDRGKGAQYLWLFLFCPLVFSIIVAVYFITDAYRHSSITPIGIIGYAGLFITGIWMFIELVCLRGTVGGNKYGSDPLER